MSCAIYGLRYVHGSYFSMETECGVFQWYIWDEEDDGIYNTSSELGFVSRFLTSLGSCKQINKKMRKCQKVIWHI